MDDEMVVQFENHYGAKIPSWWPIGRLLVASTISARAAVGKEMGLLEEPSLRAEPSIGLLYHLADRVYEQVTASIICFSSKQGTGAEVCARVALESSINLRFILTDRNTRTLAWLQAYVDQDRKQVDQWEKLLVASSPAEAAEFKPRILRRRQLNESRKDFVGLIEREFSEVASVDKNLLWPSIKDRFEAIGESTAYRTAYARMSSQTHADAEDSINYMLATLTDSQDLQQRLGEETVAYSEFLVLYGCYFYLRALVEFCRTFGLPFGQEMAMSVDFVLKKMRVIGEKWEW